MAFTSVCKRIDLEAGEWLPFNVNGEAIMPVWADGNYPRACRGLCPHGQASFQGGLFNGRVILCTVHGREFDARTGKSLVPPGWALEEYLLRMEGDWLQVDMDRLVADDSP